MSVLIHSVFAILIISVYYVVSSVVSQNMMSVLYMKIFVEQYEF